MVSQLAKIKTFKIVGDQWIMKRGNFSLHRKKGKIKDTPYNTQNAVLNVDLFYISFGKCWC